MDMQVNLHFVILEELPEIPSVAAAAESAVVRIEIVRGCQPGEMDFDDLAPNTEPLT
jgi:hypothetical protein